MNTLSRSVTPRLARAATTSGCARNTWSHSLNSSTVKLACTPGMWSNDSTRSSVSHTTLLKVALVARCKQITAARRGGAGPASSNARSSALPGSILSIAAIRQARAEVAPAAQDLDGAAAALPDQDVAPPGAPDLDVAAPAAPDIDVAAPAAPDLD